MKLAGGSPTISPLLNVDAFLAQARAYNEFSNTELGEVLRELQTAQLTHPLPVLRAKEIDRWASSRKYQDILQSLTKDVYNDNKSGGGWRNW